MRVAHDPYRARSRSTVKVSRQVPNAAADVAAWIRAADGEEAATRAGAAWAVELTRRGRPRPEVTDAVREVTDGRR